MLRRCGVCNWVTHMRKVFLAGFAAPLAILLSTSAMADTAIGVACREYAAAVADEYMSDRLVRLNGSETAGEGFITVHSYGRKYLMPRHVPGQGAIVRNSILGDTREWGVVYTEERRRCLRTRLLGELDAGN